MSIFGHIGPIAVIVEIIQTGYLRIVRYVLIADRAPVRIVIVRIIKVPVVVGVASVICRWVAVGVVVIADGAGYCRRQLRNDSFRGLSRRQSQQLAFGDLAGSAKTNNVRGAAQAGSEYASGIVDPDLIESRFGEVNRSVGSAYLEELIVRKGAHREHTRPLAQRQLSSPLVQ